MSTPVKRTYRSARREEAARRTREAIVAAALRRFVAQGYVATTMAAIAEDAGVALDTVYAAVGTKPVLFRLLIERAISGSEGPVPADERDYVQAIHAAPDARRKLEIYAAAVRRTQEGLAPLFLVLQSAASVDSELAALWVEIAERRAGNMRRFAAELAATGALRADLPLDEVSDIIWSMNASEYYVLLVHTRGWSPERFERWLLDAWTRLLLEPIGPSVP